jgi:multicomponent Na+:H+ antiporter subunit E
MTGRSRATRWPALVVLTVVWVLLWDQVSVFLLVTGLLLALLVGVVFPLPPIELHSRIRFIPLVKLGARLLLDLVRSSAAVVLLAFKPGPPPRSAIIKVQLRSRNDLYLTQVAELTSLVPGSIVLEAHRATSTLYLHVLDTVAEEDLVRARQDVLDAELRILRAFGTPEELQAAEQGLTVPRSGSSALVPGDEAPSTPPSGPTATAEERHE